MLYTQAQSPTNHESHMHPENLGLGGWPYPGSIPDEGHLSRYVTSHPVQLSLAIPSWVGTMSTSQRAVMPCGWGVKADMVRVWVTGKTVWPPCHMQAISERFRDELIIKRYINSPSLLLLYTGTVKGELNLYNKWQSDDLFHIVINENHPRGNRFWVILKILTFVLKFTYFLKSPIALDILFLYLW